MVGNIVDVGWATIKSGCLPITAIGPPKEDGISKEKTILMTSIWTNRTSAVRKEGLRNEKY